MMMKTVSLAALFAVAASASFAGSLNQSAETEEPANDYIAPVIGTGIGVPTVVGSLVAGAVVAAIVSDSDEDTDTPVSTD